MITAAATPLGRELLGHLDEQLRSIERLQSAVTALGVAVSARDAPAVVLHTGTIEAETTFRGTLEERRTALLVRGGALLGIEPWQVTVSALCTLISPLEATTAQERSERLVAATEAVHHDHRCNRALMQQELTFIDHLRRLGGNLSDVTYEPPTGARVPSPSTPAALPNRVLDLQA